MRFLFNPSAGAEELKIFDEEYRYLFKVRRLKRGERVNVRNLKDSFLYLYEISQINKKDAFLKLIDKMEERPFKPADFHLIWCMIDNKVVEKTLPVLNQIGLKRITFVYCERSQKNFKTDTARMKKILINSSQQCGRSDLMEIEVFSDLDEVIETYRDLAVLDFDGKKESFDLKNVKRVLIGCEGGFSDIERRKLSGFPKFGLKTELVLKSETAAVAICSKLLI